MPEPHDRQIKRSAFWSGSITFGLVSIPVALLAGSRSRGVRLRMLAPDGTPLSRRYYCPREDRPVAPEEIIRGYEIEKGRFITVTDEELDALQPEKSREIDLRLFVPAGRIDPVMFDRAYFLVPTGDSKKPYKLLAETMEKTGRAGIATFVMRGKEYLVAILSENGLLRAANPSICRRDPPGGGSRARRCIKADVPEETLKAMTEAIRAARSDGLDMEALADEEAARLETLVAQKQAAGEGALPAAAGQEETEQQSNVIDLMAVLKRSLQEEESSEDEKVPESANGSDRVRESGESLAHKNKKELYDLARELHIAGRTTMNKDQLIDAIRHSS